MNGLNRWILVISLLVSSLAAGMIALHRLRVEQSNRAVELVLDYPDVAQWASAEGKTVAEWLRGFNTPFSVALTEGTLDDWGAPLAAPKPTYLLSEARFQQAKRMFALKARVELQPPRDAPAVEIRSERGARFWVVGDSEAIRQMGLGLDLLQVEQVRAGGKPIVARLVNPQGITPLALRGSLLFAREQGATLLIFAGDQVLGYRRGLEATAQNIKANAQRFGAIEFAKQMGAGNLMGAIPDRTVRVHSIGLAESLTLSPQEIVERLERAAQERNIRVLYLRAAGADPPLLREILESLTKRLDGAGYTIRESGARPFEPLQPALWQFALVGLGVGVLLGWLITLFRSGGYWAFAPMALGVLFALLCLLPLGRKLVALTAALAFPTVGMVALAGLAGSPHPPAPLSHAVGEGEENSPLPRCGRGAGGEGAPNPPLPQTNEGTGGEREQNSPLPRCGRGAGGEGAPNPPLPQTNEGTGGEREQNSPLPRRGRGAGGEGAPNPPLPQTNEGTGGEREQNSPLPRRGRGAGGEGFLRLASLLIIPFAWSLMGALHIVGLLGETPFLIKADQFAGVKVAHALPLLLVLIFYTAWTVGRWDFWREWLDRPVLWGQVALALVILGALGFMLVRTGNEAPGAVPDWELRLRAMLETVMNVRPRTKEFLVGHPALVIAATLLLSGRTRWLPLAMFLATIGQVSIVNTFCHLHSPLLVSLQRTGWGILIGVGLGFVLLALWKVVNPRITRAFG